MFVSVMKKEMMYESPLVEVIVVSVEKGFAGSNMENLEEGDETEW